MNLAPEFRDAVQNLTTAHINRLVGLGVPRAAVHGLRAVVGATTARIEGGRWEPDPDGTPVVVVPVGLPGIGGVGWCDVIDLVAFRTVRPDTWWLRTGAAVTLCPEAADVAATYDVPVNLHATPLDWLRGGAGAWESAPTGDVVLNWHAALSLYLGHAPRVICDTVDLGKRLDPAMRGPRQPAPQVSGDMENWSPSDMRK